MVGSRAGMAEARAGVAPIVSVEAALMGGRVGVHVRPGVGRGSATRDAERALQALRRWVARLTRFDPASELSMLNADPGRAVRVGPTIAAVLDWGRAAETETNGVVNVALLDQRLAAEGGAAGRQGSTLARASDAWSIERGPRGAVIRRPAGLRFDLDGVAKGWLADRVAGRLERHPAVVVDADGDIAIHLGAGESWDIGVTDALDLERTIATLRLAAAHGSRRATFGIATSGTSVHRWPTTDGPAHHLIDPRTGRPALTDVVQATVVAASARVAEAFAKAAVILGSAQALAAFDRPPVDGLILLTERREILATPRTLRYLA